MTRLPTSPADRRAHARAALEALDGHLSDHRKLAVRCRRSHHVAAVYDAGGELVYSTTVGTRPHGNRDRIDTGHGGDERGRSHVDLLDAGKDPGADDELPASCECGPRTLSRVALRSSVEDNLRVFIVD